MSADSMERGAAITQGVESRDVASLLKAAAHPDRLRILEVLLESRMNGLVALTITDIACRTELSRFSASRHLALLANAQLVGCAIEAAVASTGCASIASRRSKTGSSISRRR
ncbi:ArsR family transcriptional regulator [Microbacterium yannicii]|uniref:ArsR family transcriptional regulator n=1 Tax=Microbacterium yannicii TaxID=671622 RepID=UPI0012F9ECC8|nr:ArsR family transcriptional regulator [Microbacterium yannicii]